MIFWRSRAAQKQPEAGPTTGQAFPSVIRHIAGSAARRAVKRNAALAPKDGSVQALVDWYRELGFAGLEIMQAEIWQAYRFIGGHAGHSCVSLREFKTELRKAGCDCWQADLRSSDGSRPEMVRFPVASVSTADAALASAAEDKAMVPLMPAGGVTAASREDRRRTRHFTSGTLGRQQNALPYPTKNKSGRALPYRNEKHSEVNQIAA